MSVDLRARANLPRRGGRRVTPVVLQMETTECGAACIAMILAYYGRWVPLEELRVRCGVSRDGSRADSMLRAAREYGLLANGYRCEPEDLRNFPFPLVVFWNFNHFIVVEGFRKGRYHVVDPAHGPQQMSAEEFDEGFTGVCLAFSPGPDMRRGGSRPGAWRGLFSRLGNARAPLFFAMLATLALTAPALATATLTKVFIDDVLIPRSDAWITPVLAGLAVAALMQGLLVWMQQVCLARMEIKLSLVMTTRFFWHILTLPITFFGQRFIGDISNRVASNERVAQLLSGQLAGSAIGVLRMGAFAAVMYAYDAQLTLVAFAIVLVNLLSLRFVSRARDDGSRRLLKEQGKMAGATVNGLDMIETVKANGSEGELFARWSGMSVNALVAQQELSRLTGLLGLVPPFLSALGTVAILGIGGLRLLEGGITVGSLVAFQLLTQQFLAPIAGIVQFGANFQTARGDLARLDDILRYEPDERAVKAVKGPPREAPEPTRGRVTFENVTFGYNAQEPPLIEDLSFGIPPGQRVALVGGSGSGKSTVARLLAGLIHPWSGEVAIDGRSVEQIPLSHFSGMLSYVDQDIALFEGTVRENVTLWNSTIEENQVTRALRDAAVHAEIMSRPEKYDAPVEEGGRNFSGGQRQRIEIARALASDPAILVLDEATAALDPVTESDIDDHLRRRGCTCLIVAHRLSTVRDADEIIVLAEGAVVQRGTHEELIADKDGVYYSLVTSS